jgi:excisionase family DNA binding protein
MEKLISTKKVAEYLDVKPITVRRLANSGQIPFIRIGNRLRFDKQEIDKWLRQRTNGRLSQILVVDDEPTVGDLIRNTLEMGRYQVTTTLSSLEALELINQQRFDLIFLDLVMPELDGAELFKHIREIDKDVPVVIVTGYPPSEVMARAIEYGPFSVIKKPFTINDITSTVNTVSRSTVVKG